jgi:hypothetical protein
MITSIGSSDSNAPSMKIAANAFQLAGDKVKELFIGQSVTSIGNGAFSDYGAIQDSSFILRTNKAYTEAEIATMGFTAEITHEIVAIDD